jgi:hypothetical protein
MAPPLLSRHEFGGGTSRDFPSGREPSPPCSACAWLVKKWRSILLAHIVFLSVEGRRIVHAKKKSISLHVGSTAGLRRFPLPRHGRTCRADLRIGGVRRASARVAHGVLITPGIARRISSNAPEATAREVRPSRPRGVRRLRNARRDEGAEYSPYPPSMSATVTNSAPPS